MKQLLGMSRDKKKDAPPKQPQFDEPSEEQVLQFAQMIGIELPQDRDLLYLAREGVMAQLPAGWLIDTTPDGEILYINEATGEETFEHPCDEYYRQRVLQEKAKKRKMSDPLLRQQQEKEVRRVEEQRRQEQEQKKEALKRNYDAKKAQLLAQLKKEEELTKKSYQEERQRRYGAMQREQSHKEAEIASALQVYERELYDRERGEPIGDIKLLESKYKTKREGLVSKYKEQLKNEQKILQQKYKEQMKEVQEEEDIPYQKMYAEEAQRVKNEIIRENLKEHAGKLKAESEKQRILFQEEIKKIEEMHEEKLKSLKSMPANKINVEELIKQCENEEAQEMKSFQYQLKTIEETFKFKYQVQLESFKKEIEQKQKEAIQKNNSQIQRILAQVKNNKEQEYQQKIWEAQKRSKQQYLKSLKKLQEHYTTQEQIIKIGNKNKNQQNPLLLKNVENKLRDLKSQQQKIKKQLQKIRNQIQDLQKQQKYDTKNKLTENQLHLFDLIQNKIRTDIRSE